MGGAIRPSAPLGVVMTINRPLHCHQDDDDNADLRTKVCSASVLFSFLFGVLSSALSSVPSNVLYGVLFGVPSSVLLNVLPRWW